MELYKNICAKVDEKFLSPAFEHTDVSDKRVQLVERMNVIIPILGASAAATVAYFAYNKVTRERNLEYQYKQIGCSREAFFETSCHCSCSWISKAGAEFLHQYYIQSSLQGGRPFDNAGRDRAYQKLPQLCREF